jgi:hypothetical protein
VRQANLSGDEFECHGTVELVSIDPRRPRVVEAVTIRWAVETVEEENTEPLFSVWRVQDVCNRKTAGQQL